MRGLGVPSPRGRLVGAAVVSVLAFLGASPGVRAASAPLGRPLEGEVVLTVRRPGAAGPRAVEYQVKDDRVRSSPVLGPIVAADVIVDLRKRTADLVVDVTRTHSHVHLPHSEAALAVNKTGVMDEVSGWSCEDWIITTRSDRLVACVVRDTAYFDYAGDLGAGRFEPDWAEALTRERAFPLRIRATDASGAEEFVLEATRVEAKPLDDAVFEVPAGYRDVPVTRIGPAPSVP